MDTPDLIENAFQAQRFAYAPYSKFAVGAALLTKSGKVFLGCNVENISLGLTMCAEQAAVASAVASGDIEFVSVAVVSNSKEPVIPCGRCRQILAEFNPGLEVIASTVDGRIETFQLNALLPLAKQGILESLKNV
jgi:cytidine deaminase